MPSSVPHTASRNPSAFADQAQFWSHQATGIKHKKKKKKSYSKVVIRKRENGTLKFSRVSKFAGGTFSGTQHHASSYLHRRAMQPGVPGSERSAPGRAACLLEGDYSSPDTATPRVSYLDQSHDPSIQADPKNTSDQSGPILDMAAPEEVPAVINETIPEDVVEGTDDMNQDNLTGLNISIRRQLSSSKSTPMDHRRWSAPPVDSKVKFYMENNDAGAEHVEAEVESQGSREGWRGSQTSQKDEDNQWEDIFPDPQYTPWKYKKSKKLKRLVLFFDIPYGVL